MAIEQVVQAIAVTAELTGTTLSAAAQAMMAKDLAGYPEGVVIRSLERFRRESKARLTLAGVIALVEEEDGRPSADEAWAMCPRGEGDSVFWTAEIQTALGIARPVLESGDKVGARMAFKDAYDRLVREARAAKTKPEWSLSIGWDKAGRAEAVTKAVARGLISAQAAQQYLPAATESPVAALLAGKDPLPLLTCDSPAEYETAVRGVAKLREVFAKSARRNAEENERQAKAEAKRREDFESERARQLSMAAERLAKEGGAAA